MRPGLFWKLFLLQMVAAAAVLAGALFVTRIYSVRHFSEFLEARQREHVQMLAAEVAEHYVESGDLERAAEDARVLRVRHHRGADDPRAPLPPEIAHMPPMQLQDATGAFVRGDRRVLRDERLREPITVDGRVVGYLAWPAFPVDPDQSEFARKQARHFAIIAPIAMLVAALCAFAITALIVRPIRRLSAGAAALARREFATRLPESRHDELGQLAIDFNRMAASLEGFDQRQRQWLADIAHELRTPVSILRGELEAVLDGVRPASPDLVRSLHQEVGRLGALIEDLHLVSLAESGGLKLLRVEADVGRIVQASVVRFQDRFAARGMTVKLALAHDATAPVDVQRFEQVLANVFGNVLQHAEPGPVTVSVRADDDTTGSTAAAAGGHIYVSVADSGPGVPADVLPRLFDRLYRVESARTRAAGGASGAGLGLSISKSIVEAHGGTIEARAADAGGAKPGLEVVIRLPRELTR